MTILTIAGRSILLAAIVVAGATATAANAQSAPAPAMKVGDRWVYNVQSGVGIATITYQETREVTSVSASGFMVKVTGKTAGGADFTRVDDYAAPGSLRSGALCIDQVYRFPTPLQRVPFPIATGQRSSRWVNVLTVPDGNRGQINYSFRTRSWENLTLPAGAFNAIRIDVLMTLDDADAFRHATNCNFTYWYSPAVRGTVRERRSAQFQEMDAFTPPQRVLSASYELASFTPGKP